ncbi:MAG: hypothetical protein LWW94_07270 [Candidatus Desulfofervidaceae bacterium]|nr:hypothetical protein [Candidatus Desulfofervidaceae bacterium]
MNNATLPCSLAEITLAALLHDIGKFAQRAGEIKPATNQLLFRKTLLWSYAENADLVEKL